MKKILILKLLLLTILSYSQDLQNSNWVYSNTLGLNLPQNGNPTQFSVTGAPQSFSNAPYLEGCASVSDQNGNLLMFSNGINVWCRNSQNNFVIVNGQLQGDPSSVQNVIFIPRPGYPSRYYIVTINGNTDYLNNGSGFKGLYYQEIDTASQAMVGQSTALSFQDPELNSLITVNQQFGNISESITSTKHSNGKDFWLLAHIQNNNGGRLLSFRVTCSGFQTNGITGPTNVLTIETGKATAIKVSPNSQKFALFSEDSVRYGTFNNTNGSFFQSNVIANVASYNGEFSPNSNILFYSNANQLMARNLAVSQSDVIVANTGGFYGIQIARDNKIYFTGTVKSVSNRIRVIGSPDQFNAFNVTSTSFYHPQIGFPQTVHWGNEQNIVANNDSYTFNFCSTTPVNYQSTSVEAVFQNDTNNSSLITTSAGYTFNTVGSVIPSLTSGGITLNSNGTITVSAGTPVGVYTLMYNICTSQSCPQCSNVAAVTIIVTQTTAVIPTFNQVGPFCAGTSFALPASSTNNLPITGTWSPAINNMTTTTYTFTPNAGQCATTATMTVVVEPVVTPVFDQLGPFCAGTSFVLPTSSTNNPSITGTWSPAINNMATTTYTFTSNTGQCVATKTMTIVIKPYVTPVFNQVGPVCAGTTFTLPTTSNAPGFITGIWSPAINNMATTTYTFTPNAGQCVTGIPVQMTVVVKPNVLPTFNAISPICEETSFTLPTLSTNNPPITGTWSPAINNMATTTYTFTPNSGQCANSVTLTVPVISLSAYNLSILDQYVDGTQSGSNIVGLYVNGNFPSTTIYEWIVYREDSSVNNYPATTQTLRYVAASFDNRITYVEVIAYYGNCSRLFASTFHCAIPNSDQYGHAFPDCSGHRSFKEKDNTLKGDLIKIYPNPVSSEINFEGLGDFNYTISIYDSFGKLVLRNEKIKEKIDFANYNKGFYFYEINQDDLIIQRGKLIKN